MFRKTTLFFLSVAAILSLSIFLLIFSTDKDDATDAYQVLEEGSCEVKKNKIAMTNYCEQRREGVTKEIFLRDETTSHVRIISASSEIFFFYEKHAVEVEELLKNVLCTMQEELFYLLPDGREVIRNEAEIFVLRKAKHTPITVDQKELQPMQYVRFFKAEKARYNYNSGLFIADNVELWKYRLEGHELPSNLKNFNPIMQGTATSAQFVLKNSRFDFQAENLKASFTPKRGMI